MKDDPRSWQRRGFWFTMGAAWAVLLLWTVTRLAWWIGEGFWEEWSRW